MNAKTPTIALLVLLLMLLCCRNTTHAPDLSVSGFTDGPSSPPPPDEPEPTPGVLVCPGETQCPCGPPSAADESGPSASSPCAEGLLCGPTGACTHACALQAECTSGVSGESCIGSHCAVLCDPAAPHGGCQAAGMPGAECLPIFGVNVCGYR